VSSSLARLGTVSRRAHISTDTMCMRQLAHDTGKRRKLTRVAELGLPTDIGAGAPGWALPIKKQLRLSATLRR